MLALFGTALNMTTPSPFTRLRDYEAFLRAPALAVTHRFGTVDAYRMGGQHLGKIAEFPTPRDSHVDESGITESGEVAVAIADTDVATVETVMGWRNQLVDLELVTRLYREDGSTVEMVNERRGVVKRATRRGVTASLDVADVDREALKALIPSKTFTVADWPKLFADHVGRPITQGVGTILKVPLTYVDNTPGAYKYAGPEVIGSAAAVLTLYRNGRVVSASEYAVGTAAAGGNTVVSVTFAQEQADFQGGLYTLEADFLCPGSRLVTDEIRRVLQLLGATTEWADSLALWANVEGIRVDCAYVEKREGAAILEDLLAVARGQLYRTPSGAYGLFIDRPRDVRLALADSTDELQVDSDVKPEIVKTIRLEYRPSSSQREEFTGKLERTCNGAVGEKTRKSPYIRDHDVADRHLCYLQKRENALAQAVVAVHGVQLAPGDLVAITSATQWNGSRIFAAPRIVRPPDRNQLEVLEYDPTIYAYTPATLPAGATNGYLPDYSQTPPVAPTALTVVSQGTSADTDGKVTAFALVRATPPAVNWQKLMVVARDTTTNEQYFAQLLLNAGNYEATIAGLRPNRSHTVEAWAVNATNVDGVHTAAVAFTSANYTTAPSAPASIGSQQQSPRQVLVSWGAVSDVAGQPKIRRYVVFKKVNAGSFTEQLRTDATSFVDDNVNIDGTSYQYKVRSEDINGNESADSSTTSITPQKLIDDAYIIGSGVSGASIANASINQARGYTGTGGTSVSVGAGSSQGVDMDVYSFFPNLDHGGSSEFCYVTTAGTKSGAVDQGRFRLRNNSGSSVSVSIDWRKFLA